MRTPSVIATILAASLLTPAALAAQAVRGGVYQSDTGEAVAGAMVVLIDEAGAPRTSGLTNEAGRFALNARTAGNYALRVQRIGFQDVFTERFHVAAGATVERDVRVAPQAIVLEGITAEARRRCVTRPRDGLAVATLWEEARKALAAAAYTELESRYRFRVNYYRRDLDLNSLRVRREEMRGRVGFAEGSPFVSLPAERLLTEGFVSLADTASFYYAPDAHVLLSDGFLDAYCFRIAEQGTQPDHLIGLAFEPADRRGPPAVQGALWLDRRTFELQHLEYGYTRVPAIDGPTHRLGGRVEFERLPNGTWIVRRWWIRMPQLQAVTARRAGGPRATLRITALHEEGGEVAEVTAASGARVRASAAASLSGVVFDSAAGIPLKDAVVEIVGTERGAVADDAGRYRLEDLPEGRYDVTFSHPRTALYGFEPRPVTVTVGRDAEMSLDLGIPLRMRGAGLLSACPRDVVVTGAAGVLRGTVRDEYTAAAVPRAQVTFSWEDGATGEVASRTVTAGADGRYIVCGLPEGAPLDARVRVDGRSADHAGVAGPGLAGFAERDLTLSLTDPQPVTITLIDHESGSPIRDAEVALPSLGLRAVTNRRGTVSFAAVRPGTHEVRIDHLGYGTHSRDIVMGTEPEVLEVRVPARAIALQGIEVTVRSAIQEARRTRGTRINVMDREEIARLERTAEHVGHLAQRIPGLRLTETYHGFSGLRSGICIRGHRGTTGSGAEPCVVIILDGLPLADTDVLLALGPDAIEAIEYINPIEAGPRYGTVAGQVGALLVWTRGNGPYARRTGGAP